MTFCLYECLRAVGLQHHYARFASVGVHRAAHLSGLTMEDYPLLGIRSMEDRTRLFHLVQMIKTLDLESLEYEDDDDYNSDGGDEGIIVADSSVTYDGCGDPDECVYEDVDEKGAAASKLNASSFSKPSCVRRRLNFDAETINHHQKQFPRPMGIAHVYANHNRNNEPGQDRGSTVPLLDSGSAVVCSCKGRNNHMLDVHMHQSEHQTRADTKPNDVEGTSTYSSLTESSPKCVSSPKLTHWPPAVGNKGFSSKPVRPKDSRGKEHPYTEISSKPTPVFESKKAADYNYGLPLRSPSASNKRQTGGPRISVCVRKRPLTRSECRRGETDVVTTSSPDCVIVHEGKEAVDLTQYILQHRFYFNQVLGEDSSNEEVYQRTAYPLVQHMLNGGKATCFAYGQTGAGKTHTMLGSSSGRPGLYALAVRDIFSHLSTAHTQSHLLVYVSFFEIYCGQLYDLLDHRKRLFAREDGQKVVHIAGLRDVRVDSVSSLLQVISQGTEERTQGVSGVNPLSSRSHALLQIQLRHPNQQIAGRMWFVDLAGSERASDTKAQDKQSRMEGAEINQSLLALKECIRSLDQEQLHTPFRQSKLTQVLKDSFVGDSMTCMIANISPGHLAAEHTLNTLRYADRVKELRGQGGGREGRRSKTTPSPKRNLFNSNNSSVGTRGKSPPKKQKLGSRNEAFGINTPTKKMSARGSILCSTPKNCKWEEETGSSARREIEFEQITPIKGLLGGGDKRERGERGVVREGRRRERCEVNDSAGPSNVRAEPVSRQVTELPSWELQRESEFHHKEKKNQQSTLRGAREGGERWVELRRQGESKGGRCSEVESLRERESQPAGERDKERESHLRQYHQQLQQFMPSSTSSSVRFYSPSTCLSSSSSNQASLTSSVSPSACPSVQHPASHLSVPADMHHGLEDVLNAYGAKAEVRAGGNRGQLPFFPREEISLQTETSHGYSAVTGEDLRAYWEGTEERFGQKAVKSDDMGSPRAPSEGEVRGREGWRPAEVEGGGRRWAWVATTGTEQADRVTGARPADVEAVTFYNRESEVGERGLDASDVPADRAWSAEEQDGADGFGLASTHSDTDGNILFNHRLSETPHQRSPAERPLSPACEHTSTSLTPNKLSHLSINSQHDRGTSNTLPPPLQNSQQGVSTRGCRQKEAWFAANANKRDPSDAQPPTAAITRSECTTCVACVRPLNIPSENPAHTQIHNHAEVKAKMSVLPQEERSTDSLSYIMDPLSISLLQVDQQVASASFLQGEKKKFCALENKMGKDKRQGKVVEDEDVESSLSLFEMLQAKIQSRPTPQTTAAVMGNKAPISLLKPSTCASMETSVTQSSSSSFKDSENTGSPSSLMKNGGTQMPQDYAQTEHSRRPFSILAPQSENVLAQLNTLPKQCHSVHSNHSNNSRIPLQPNRPSELDSQESINQQIRPVIHLSTLEGLDHGQLRVVQAHWEQLEEMETLWRKEGTLLCQQPDMVFGEYVHKLGEIMERKARCVHSMMAQLQPYLRTSRSNQPHYNREDNHNKTGH